LVPDIALRIITLAIVKCSLLLRFAPLSILVACEAGAADLDALGLLQRAVGKPGDVEQYRQHGGNYAHALPDELLGGAHGARREGETHTYYPSVRQVL